MAERLPNPNPDPNEFDPLKNGLPEQPSTEMEISARQRRLWNMFQHTATSLTHLYKCKSASKSQPQTSPQDQESWLAFQSAASSLTSLYRESADILTSLEKQSQRASSDLSSSLRILSTGPGKSEPQDISVKPPPSSTLTSSTMMENNDDHELANSNATNDDSSLDFLNCSTRFKRSWSPWSPDDDMDHFDPKRRKFI